MTALPWEKVARSGECWVWTGSVSGYGYGYGADRSEEYAHRLFYRELVGPIPKGWQVDHLCLNKLCVRPEHLEAVTRGENIRRAQLNGDHFGRRKTHCPRGHAYTPDNLIQRKDNGKGRECLTCCRERQRAYRAYRAA